MDILSFVLGAVAVILVLMILWVAGNLNIKMKTIYTTLVCPPWVDESSSGGAQK